MDGLLELNYKLMLQVVREFMVLVVLVVLVVVVLTLVILVKVDLQHLEYNSELLVTKLS